MTANNGWPGKPGVPMNPEKDGWHWLQAKYYDDPVGPFMAFFWGAAQQTWPKIQPYGGRTFHYLGPVLTPDEATALQARVAELEVAGATMTATNGWPGKPGVPMNPEKDGWHFLRMNNGTLKPTLWQAKGYWINPPGASGATSPETTALWNTYLGPCLTPDEVQNLRDDLASAERERAHQHGRADRNAAEYAREQGKREALQKRVAELERALRPFAGVGEFIAKHHPDPETDQNHETATLVRHFRNAYIALEGKKA